MPEKTRQDQGDDLTSKVEAAGADFALKRRRDMVRSVLREMDDKDWLAVRTQLQSSLKHPRARDGVEILERVYRKWELLEDIDEKHPELAHSSAKAMAFKTVDWIASDQQLMERLERMNEALVRAEADMTREELRWALHRMPAPARQRVISYLPPNTLLVIKAKAAGKPIDKTNGLERDRLLAEDFFEKDLSDEEAAESYKLTVNGVKATIGGILNTLIERPLARKAAGEFIRVMVKIPIMGEQEVRKLMPKLTPGARDELMDAVPKHTWKDRSLIARDKQVVREYFTRTDWSVRRFAEEYASKHKGDPGFEGLKERSADQIIARMCAKISEEPALARKIRGHLSLPEPILPGQRLYLGKLLRIREKPAAIHAPEQDSPFPSPPAETGVERAEQRPESKETPSPSPKTPEPAKEAAGEVAQPPVTEPPAPQPTPVAEKKPEPTLAEIKEALAAALQPLKPAPSPPQPPAESAKPPEPPDAVAQPETLIEPAAPPKPQPPVQPPLPELIIIREPPKPAEPKLETPASPPLTAPQPKPPAPPHVQPKQPTPPPKPEARPPEHKGKRHRHQEEQPIIPVPQKSPDELSRETFDHTLLAFRGRYSTRVHMLEDAGISQRGLFAPIGALSEADDAIKLGATRLIEYLSYVRVERNEAALEPLTRYLRDSLNKWAAQGVKDEDLTRFAMQKVMTSDAGSGKWTDGKTPKFMDDYILLGLDYEEQSRKLPENQYMRYAEAEELYKEIAAAMLN